MQETPGGLRVLRRARRSDPGDGVRRAHPSAGRGSRGRVQGVSFRASTRAERAPAGGPGRLGAKPARRLTWRRSSRARTPLSRGCVDVLSPRPALGRRGAAWRSSEEAPRPASADFASGADSPRGTRQSGGDPGGDKGRGPRLPNRWEGHGRPSISPMLFLPPHPPVPIPGGPRAGDRSQPGLRPCGCRAATPRGAMPKSYCTPARASLLRDLGSTNGSFVNGQPVQPSTCLQPGDRIEVAGSTITFCQVIARRLPCPSTRPHPDEKTVLTRATRAQSEVFRGELGGDSDLRRAADARDGPQDRRRTESSARKARGSLWLFEGRPIHADHQAPRRASTPPCHHRERRRPDASPSSPTFRLPRSHH